jgi:tryptophanyl-tRNA synthetase
MSKAITDAGPTEPNTPPSPAVQNLFDLMKMVSNHDTLKHFTDSYANCSIRYGDLKKQLAEDMINEPDTYVDLWQEKLKGN